MHEFGLRRRHALDVPTHGFHSPAEEPSSGSSMDATVERIRGLRPISGRFSRYSSGRRSCARACSSSFLFPVPVRLPAAFFETEAVPRAPPWPTPFGGTGRGGAQNNAPFGTPGLTLADLAALVLRDAVDRLKKKEVFSNRKIRTEGQEADEMRIRVVSGPQYTLTSRRRSLDAAISARIAGPTTIHPFDAKPGCSELSPWI